MAVDTKAKRFSMLNFGGESLVLIDPDGTVGVPDRLHFLNLYSGIAADAPSVEVALTTAFPPDTLTLSAETADTYAFAIIPRDQVSLTDETADTHTL